MAQTWPWEGTRPGWNVAGELADGRMGEPTPGG